MSRNFAIRLQCPVEECDSWLTLQNRDESIEQILQQSWEFNCRRHGRQRGVPVEAIELAPLGDEPSRSSSPPAPVLVPFSAVPSGKMSRANKRLSLRMPVVVYGWTKKSGAFHEETETLMVNSSGALVILKTALELGDTAFLVHKSSGKEQEVRVAYLDAYSDRETRVGLAFKQPAPDFWKRARKNPRVPKSLRVVVKGLDSRGHPFVQSAYTVDLSQEGARLDGVGFLTAPGQTIEVRRLWRKARFRVVWIGQVGTVESNHVGLFGLDADKNIWRLDLPSGQPPESPRGPKSPKK
jgi:hypothetical protein